MSVCSRERHLLAFKSTASLKTQHHDSSFLAALILLNGHVAKSLTSNYPVHQALLYHQIGFFLACQPSGDVGASCWKMCFWKLVLGSVWGSRLGKGSSRLKLRSLKGTSMQLELKYSLWKVNTIQLTSSVEAKVIKSHTILFEPRKCFNVDNVFFAKTMLTHRIFIANLSNVS